MSSLRAYEIWGIDEFLVDSRKFFKNLQKSDKKAFREFKKNWDEWLEDPEIQKFDSHYIRGKLGKGDWILWRSKLDLDALRIFYFVNHKRKVMLIIEIRNDHAYDDVTLDKIERKGTWKTSHVREAVVAEICRRSFQKCYATCKSK